MTPISQRQFRQPGGKRPAHMSSPGVSGVPMKSAPHRQNLLAERRRNRTNFQHSNEFPYPLSSSFFLTALDAQTAP